MLNKILLGSDFVKLVAIIGSNNQVSYNRLLIEFIAKHYPKFHLEKLEVRELPLFNEDIAGVTPAVIEEWSKKISKSDGVIIACPEYNHSVTASLKSTIEWMSYQVHPLKQKPVMILGASTYPQGSSRAQLHLRQILNSPGVDADVFQGQEFLLGQAKTAFNAAAEISDPKTVSFLAGCLQDFAIFVKKAKKNDKGGK